MGGVPSQENHEKATSRQETRRLRGVKEVLEPDDCTVARLLRLADVTSKRTQQLAPAYWHAVGGTGIRQHRAIRAVSVGKNGGNQSRFASQHGDSVTEGRGCLVGMRCGAQRLG